MTGALRSWALEWADWWRSLPALNRLAPLGWGAAYVAAQALLGGLRPDHINGAAAVVALAYAGPRARPLLRWLAPFLIMLVVYDAQRYWIAPLRGPVHVAGPRNWELSWFGIHDSASLPPHSLAALNGQPVASGGQPFAVHGKPAIGGEPVEPLITPAAWLQIRTRPGLDLVCGAAYLFFVPVFLAMAAYWKFIWARRPSDPSRRAARSRRASAVMWAMLWLNLAGYATYLIYPAAPPWFADRYGIGPAFLQAPPEAAGALRFDALLGVHWFAGFYGRNANVFGAIPSLHVGQTFLAAYFAWRFRSLRVFATAFWLVVTFASAYLNHHYLVDGVVGIAFALAAAILTEVTLRGTSFGPKPDPRTI